MEITNLFDLIHSGCGVISIDAPGIEEDNILETILQQAHENRYHVYFWTFGQNIVKLNLAVNPETEEIQGIEVGDAVFKPTGTYNPGQEACAILDWISNYGSGKENEVADVRAIFVLADIHKLITENAIDLFVSRRIKSLALGLERLSIKKRVILLGQNIQIPNSHAGLVEEIKVKLPDIQSCRENADFLISALREQYNIPIELSSEEDASLIRALQGMTVQEMSRNFRLGVKIHGKINRELITFLQQRKIEKFQRLGVQFSPPPDVAIAGLNNWQEWIRQQGQFFTEKAAKYGIKPPKGAVLVGVPGTGKSLAAKCIASEWQIPVLSLNIGSVLSSFVGQSEERFQAILAMAESVAPAVLFIDELDKAFAGVGGGSSDSGIMDRIFGSLLSWLNDKTAPVFVIAAANDISRLPVEFLRKGRFDEIFFVGLPNIEEREAIFRIHCQKLNLKVEDKTYAYLAQETENYNGAEIAAVVSDTQKFLFLQLKDDDKEQLIGNVSDFLPIISSCRTLTESRDKEIAAILEWGKQNARPASSMNAAIAPSSKVNLNNNRRSRSPRIEFGNN
ncbi:AAA family ATPase (plasmid) [Nostoc sp. C052]|uniref:AAA family ATPase n=1 Tax=Nostoc sp. C052 TaxID=2576902 RepID=UPI0015C3C544|nr:AAA family ATPase [Nostoc sp. C052]QLE46459.1 AAA family ATPase [Nostoc sp. C052]